MGVSKLLALISGILLCSLVSVGAETVELLSVSANGQPYGSSYSPDVSADGKWAAFSSGGCLLPSDRNNHYDIYIRNLATGTLERVSVASDGSEANGPCQYPVLSADGRFVAFHSYATNLVPGDVNGKPDVFLRDRLLGTTEIISIATDGTQGDYTSGGTSISADGRFVAFHTVSRLSDDDVSPSISIYLRDRKEQTTTYITNGINPALSSDGRFFAAREYDKLILRDLQSGVVEIIAQISYDRIWTNSFAYSPSISDDGRYVVYEGWSAEDAPLSTEVFVYDRLTRTKRQITRAYDDSPLTTAAGPYSSPLKPKISSDGRYILFFSCAADLVQGIDGNQLYRHDLANKSTERLQVDNLWSTVLFPSFAFSGDGDIVVFQDTIYNHLPKYATHAFGIFALRSGITSGGGGSGGVLVEPEITAEPEMLWPPNSKLKDVKLSISAPGATAVEIRIVDEYGTFSQTAHGTDATVQLEAWRDGADKDGRTYTVTAVATDADGQQKTATTTISVPHDRR